MVITEGDMIRVDDFIHLYRLKESKEYVTTLCHGSGRRGSLLIYLRYSDTGNRGSFSCLGMDGRLFLMNFGAKFLAYFVVGEPRV